MSQPTAPAGLSSEKTSGWLSESVYFDGDAYYNDVLNAINGARTSIEIESYIYDPDPIGKRFDEALSAAAKRGLDVKLVVDGFGARSWIESGAQSVAASGVKVRIYHPIKFSMAVSRVLEIIGLSQKSVVRSRSLLSRLNRRDHRKLIIIDRTRAWVGSLNISASHSAMCSGPAAAWRDVAAGVEGSGIDDLYRGFMFAFDRSAELSGRRDWKPTILPFGVKRLPHNRLVRLNFTRRLRRRNFREFLRRIQRAKSFIWITNAYLAPPAPVVRGLIRARRRGVDVRIIVPRTSDVFFMPWVASSYYSAFLKGGVRLFEFTPSFHHAKCVIIDDWASVGTSNLNRRSLLRDLEVDVILKKPASLDILRSDFIKDLESSEEIKLARGGPRSWLGRLILSIFKQWI